jgi:outer membrane protein assembly factor BamA
MNRQLKTPLAALLAFACTCVLAAQQFTPKNIQFTGVPEYNANEILAVAQLTPGAQLEAADLDKHTKLLMDSGMFGSYSYSFDGESETLTFKLTPASNLYAVRYANLPIEMTPQVMANIHARAPLFHDKLPNSGGTLDAVITALEAEFTSRGIHAQVAASPYFDPDLNSVTAIQIVVTQPAVVIGAVNVEGASPQLAADLKKIYAPFTGTSFNTNESISTLQHRLEVYYTDHGYATVKVKVAQAAAPVLTADKIEVPFNIRIQEGHIYKIGLIKLNSKLLIPATKIESTLHPHAGDPVTGATLRDLMTLVANTYKSKGYLRCNVTPKVIADEKSGTADYQIDVDSGPVYTMGEVTFEGFPDDLALALKNNWKTPAGAPVDFPYAYSYVVKFSQHDQSTTSRLAGAKMSYILTTDPKTHVVKINYKLEQ